LKPLRALEILGALERHQVRYVVIGGLGAVLQGSPVPTLDADICPARDRENLERLAKALTDLEARIRTEAEPEGLRFSCDAAFLANVQILNLTTEAGNLDLSFVPSGTGGFESRLQRRDLEPWCVVRARGHAERHHPLEGSCEPAEGSSDVANPEAAPEGDRSAAQQARAMKFDSLMGVP